MDKILQSQTFTDKEIKAGLHILRYPGKLYQELRNEFYDSSNHWQLASLAIHEKSIPSYQGRRSEVGLSEIELAKIKSNPDFKEEVRSNLLSENRTRYFPKIIEERKIKKRYEMLKRDYAPVVNHTTLDKLLLLDELYISAINHSLESKESMPLMYLADIESKALNILYGNGVIKSMGKPTQGIAEEKLTNYKHIHEVLDIEYNPKRLEK